jgi:hypothetical protein
MEERECNHQGCFHNGESCHSLWNQTKRNQYESRFLSPSVDYLLTISLGSPSINALTFFTMSQTTHLPSPLPVLLLCGTSLRGKPIEDVSNGDSASSEGGLAILNVDDWIFF